MEMVGGLVNCSALLAMLAIATIVLTGCPESDIDPCEGRAAPAVSRMSVLIAPGTSTNISVQGIPPFHISSPPDPSVATAVFVDSTTSPAFVVMSVPQVVLLGAQTSFVISDACLTTTVSITAGIGSVTSYADNIQPIWNLSCQYRGCHPGGGAPFSLDPLVSWSNLYFAQVTNANCGDIYRVVGGDPNNGIPGNPDSSLLYLVVSGRTSCPRMPFSPTPGDTLSLSDQQMIRAWIQSGAQNN